MAVEIIRYKLAEELYETMLSDMVVMPSLKFGDFVLRLELEDLSPEKKALATKELRETPEMRQVSVAKLRELLKADSELHCPYDNDPWLIRFLRPCKFYPESAHALVKRYYGFKVKHEKIYKDLMPSSEANVFKQEILLVMPNRDQHGRRVLIIELGKKWKPSKCTLDEVFKGAVLLMEAAVLEPETQVAGAVVILDMDGLSLQQTWQFTPQFAKLIVDWLQDAVPVRVKNLHIVNQPYIFNVVFALFKPFLREKLKNRIVFHGNDRKSLHKYMDPKHLPPRYGGSLILPTITSNQWLELLMMCDAEYKELNSYGYNKK